MKVVLDTNAYRKLFEGDRKIAKILNEADEIVLPSIVIGELLEAFKLGNKEEVNRAKMWEFIREPGVSLFKPGAGTAEIYAELRIKLRKAGTPIPVNDVWIAAVAIEMEARLITDDKHFKMVPDLDL